MLLDTLHFARLNRLQHLSLARVVLSSRTLKSYLSLSGSALPALRRLSLHDVGVNPDNPDHDNGDGMSSLGTGSIEELATHMSSDRIRQSLGLFIPSSSSISDTTTPMPRLKRLTLSWFNTGGSARCRYSIEDLEEMVRKLGLRESLTHLSLRCVDTSSLGSVREPLSDGLFRTSFIVRYLLW
jgi:hypothetical protein